MHKRVISSKLTLAFIVVQVLTIGLLVFGYFMQSRWIHAQEQQSQDAVRLIEKLKSLVAATDDQKAEIVNKGLPFMIARERRLLEASRIQADAARAIFIGVSVVLLINVTWVLIVGVHWDPPSIAANP